MRPKYPKKTEAPSSQIGQNGVKGQNGQKLQDDRKGLNCRNGQKGQYR